MPRAPFAEHLLARPTAEQIHTHAWECARARLHEPSRNAPEVHRELTTSSPLSAAVEVHRDCTVKRSWNDRKLTTNAPEVHRELTTSSPLSAAVEVHRDCTVKRSPNIAS